MADVVVLVPVLGRPERVAPLVESLTRSQARLDVRPLFLVSPGDRDELAHVQASGADYDIVGWEPGPGDYARKINHGMTVTDEAWLFTGADDLAFRAGWADAAVSHAGVSGCVVGTNDLGNPTVIRGDHATHSLVRRAYAETFGTIDEPGKILHDGYDHQFCDTELVATAKRRGCWTFCREAIVEHLHPFWGKGRIDGTYEKGMAHGRADQQRFNDRRVLWTSM